MKFATALTSLLACIGAFLWGGGAALLGMVMGLVGTFLNLAGLWGVVSLANASQERQEQPGLGGALIGIGFLIKLPILIGIGLFAQKLGAVTFDAFLYGLAVVYGLLIAFALVDAQQKIRNAERKKVRETAQSGNAPDR
ncbi:MAG: hypothetical protein ABI600_15700 [Luteolibacter sp.]